jgi:alkylation response protein AidB-like acyl-CoA dehydrogenase
MLGSAEAALAMTVAHLQQREQFGVLIGTFQALQHRAARLYVELELGTSLVLEALRLLDASDGEAPVAVSSAKAFLNDLAPALAGEGAQLHGGLGMTDEADIGLYLKRARVAAAELGDSAYHHRIVAAVRGV